MISRREFFHPQARFNVNHVPLKPKALTGELIPYIELSGYTPVSSFYKHVTHETVHIMPNDWRLTVQGKESKMLRLEDIQAMSSFEMAATLASITSMPNNLLMGHALWKGISFSKLIESVGAHPEARYAQFRSVNGYVTYLMLNQLEHAILAYAMNGETLSAEQGYPVRLIVPGVYDYKMPKWLELISFVAAPASGHYESRGWSATGEVQTTSALFTPRRHAAVNGKITFSGMAFAGGRTINRIELSVDDGEWLPVPFKAAALGSWTCWQLDWMPPAPADYLVKVRATDSEGFTQSDAPNQPIFPNGSSAIHAVVFRVSM